MHSGTIQSSPQKSGKHYGQSTAREWDQNIRDCDNSSEISVFHCICLALCCTHYIHHHLLRSNWPQWVVLHSVHISYSHGLHKPEAALWYCDCHPAQLHSRRGQHLYAVGRKKRQESQAYFIELHVAASPSLSTRKSLAPLRFKHPHSSTQEEPGLNPKEISYLTNSSLMSWRRLMLGNFSCRNFFNPLLIPTGTTFKLLQNTRSGKSCLWRFRQTGMSALQEEGRDSGLEQMLSMPGVPTPTTSSWILVTELETFR